MSIPTALDLGLERIESAKVEFQVVWLKQSPSFYLHLIERISNMKLSKGPWRADGAIADPKNLSRGHHLCFSVSNVDEFVKTLENLKCQKGIQNPLTQKFSSDSERLSLKNHHVGGLTDSLGRNILGG
ncbi:hypothetical protein LXL04_008693 [Taraxacum kok-saghyz]